MPSKLSVRGPALLYLHPEDSSGDVFPALYSGAPSPKIRTARRPVATQAHGSLRCNCGVTQLALYSDAFCIGRFSMQQIRMLAGSLPNTEEGPGLKWSVGTAQMKDFCSVSLFGTSRAKAQLSAGTSAISAG